MGFADQLHEARGLTKSQRATLERLRDTGEVSFVHVISSGGARGIKHSRSWSHKGFNSNVLDNLASTPYVKGETKVVKGGKEYPPNAPIQGPRTITSKYAITDAGRKILGE